MTGAVVRPAELSDASGIATLSGELGYPSAEAEITQRLAALLGEPGQAVFVALAGADRVGWIHVAAVPRLESAGYAELGGLVVAERSRRRGVGRALVDAAAHWARDVGYDALRVRTNAIREHAPLFYRRLGFYATKTQHVFQLAISEPT